MRLPPKEEAALVPPLRRLAGPLVALTFDDGPDPDYTARILDLLAAAGVPATFFVLGRAAERHPQLVRRLLAEGHTVGSHGYSHRHPWRQSAAELREEVRLAKRVLMDITGEPPLWFRPPFGRNRPALQAAVRAEGQRMALWNRSAIDWGPWGTAAGVARRLARVRGGDVLLLHDGRNRHNRPQATLAALPQLLRLLEARGLRPVPLEAESSPPVGARSAIA